MPHIAIYRSTDELPAGFECQIRAYIRFLWHDHYMYDLEEPLIAAYRHPQYVVLAERHALISAASVIWLDIAFAGQQFKMYCLGNVFTYPSFRKQGYGNQVVEAATELIKADKSADSAILFTDPGLERFYAQSGWEHIANLSASIGQTDHPEPYNAFAMMLFLSAKAQAARPVFATQPIFLPGYGW
jgi:predicted N-acetyltransferase YhbS